ncbi:MAG: methyl-accepting chemotaxis protein [Bacteroidota bacterium]
MSRLSLKSSLWLVGIFCALGMLFLAGSAIYFSSASEKALASFVSQPIALRHSATLLYAHGLQQGQALRNILLSPDNKKGYENFSKAQNDFNEELARIGPLLDASPEMAAIGQKISALAEQWKPLQAQVVESVKAGRRDEAQDVLINKETPHWRTLRNQLIDATTKFSETATSEQSQLMEEMHTAKVTAIVISLVSLLVVAVAIAYVGRTIYRQVGGEPAYAAEMLNRFSAGDLSQEPRVAAGDKGSIIAAMRVMQGQMRRLIAETSATAGSVVHESDGMRQDASQLAATAEEQSSATSAIAAAVEQFTVSIGVMSENADEAGNLAAQSEEQAQQTLTAVSVATATIGQVSEDMAIAAVKMEELARKVSDITGIVDKIRDIADQTNLLALNAAIEAARAGEQGRGFAVVADEVRKLAELTTKSTQEISGIVGSVRTTTEAAASTMKQANGQAQEGAARTAEVREAVIAQDRSSKLVGEALGNIVGSLREQTAASTDIARRIELIAQGVEKTHIVSNDSNVRSGNLVGLSQQLKSSLQQFTV